LIAFLSAISLAAVSIIQLANFFADKKIANLTVLVDDAKPDLLSLSIGNDGPGYAIVSPVVICEVSMRSLDKVRAVLQKKEFTPEDDQRFQRYSFIVSTKKSFNIQPGTSTYIELARNEQDTAFADVLHTPNVGEKSMCTINFKHQNGESGTRREEISNVLPFLIAIAYKN
jgi:hypothetical protein